MEEPHLTIAADRNDLNHKAAELWVQSASQAIASSGRFSIALSGGSTPKSLYELLATPEWSKRVDWARVHIFWGDERYVPPDHPDSNYGMTNRALLSKVPVPKQNIHPVPTLLNDPSQTARAYEQELRTFFGNEGTPQFDFMLLGLGENGHTASLFPHTPVLHERKLLVASSYVDEVKAWRITLTLPVINHARLIVFLASGSGKATVLREVLDGPRDPERLPAQLVSADAGSLRWLVDKDAAAQRPK
jgi:6-phosphogluconolactonase